VSRRNISHLPPPAERYRVDILSHSFETDLAAAREDSLRAKKLRKRADQCKKGKRRASLLVLADLLDPAVTPDTPETLASARYLREQRIKIIGALWKAVDTDMTGQVVRFDVIKPSWACDLDGLRKESSRRLKAEFRADLLRAASRLKVHPSDLEGFLFAALHGDFEVTEGVFQPHFHAVATGDWVEVVDALRGSRSYQPTERVTRPFRAKRELTDPAYALTYVLKSYWPKKWQGMVSGVGKKRRSRNHGRIPDPHHSEILLWMHNQNLSEIILMMKLEVRKYGLFNM